MADTTQEQEGSRFGRFIGEVKDEGKRVTWPTREKAKQSVVVVLAVSILLAVYIGLLDVLLAGVYRFIF